MVYRSMPHCSTKYSPYYLVFGRDMPLAIEEYWKTQVTRKDSGDDEYEEHVKILIMRLHEANILAGQQSKLSHEISKRYYDRRNWRSFIKEIRYIYMTPLVNEIKQRSFPINTNVLLKLS